MTRKMEKRDTIIPFTIVTFKVSSRTWEYRPQLRKDQSVGKEAGQDHRKANDQIPSTKRGTYTGNLPRVQKLAQAAKLGTMDIKSIVPNTLNRMPSAA